MEIEGERAARTDHLPSTETVDEYEKTMRVWVIALIVLLLASLIILYLLYFALWWVKPVQVFSVLGMGIGKIDGMGAVRYYRAVDLSIPV